MTLVEFREMCENHDLTYSYSDDGHAYRRGEEQRTKILVAAESLPREEVVKIWNEVVDMKISAGFRETFYWTV